MDYKFEDGSQDREYFTIVPNYILNHASAVDKAIYLDIKRVAGEKGSCFMTEETMCKRNKIGKDTLHKSIKYLLDHGWIEFIGTTSGKTRPIKTYKIMNIWKQNTDFYTNKKIPPETALSKDTACKQKDTAQIGGMIPPEKGGIRRSYTKEEPIKKINHKPYSSLEDITGADLENIAIVYNVNLGFVNLQFEKMKNWLEAKGKKYKNYKRALMNWVLGDLQRQIERRSDGKYRPVDARSVE